MSEHERLLDSSICSKQVKTGSILKIFLNFTIRMSTVLKF